VATGRGALGGGCAVGGGVTYPGPVRALRWWSLLLVPGGFVAGHELGYQAASLVGPTPVAAVGHGYLAVAALVGLPFATAALARTFLAGFRAQLPPVRLRTLATGQVALFLAVELGEHASVGLGPADTLAEPAVLFGLAAQLLVAALLFLVVRSTHEAGAAVATAARRPRLRALRPLWRPTAERLAPRTVAAGPVTLRGPPAPCALPA
jgi:hypothetical protein